MRTEIRFGAYVERPAHAVWAALTSGNGIEFLLGDYLSRVLGHQRREPVGRRMQLGERYVFERGTSLGVELEVVALDAPRRFQLAGTWHLASGDEYISVDVEVTDVGGGTLVEVTPALETDSGLFNAGVSQFAIVLRDLWDQKDTDSTNLRRALEDAVESDASTPGARDRVGLWAGFGTLGANALAAALVVQSGTGLPGLALLYWTENLIIGALALAKVAVAQRVPFPVGRMVAALFVLLLFPPFWEFQADFVRSILGMQRFYELWHSDLPASLGSLQVVARFAQQAWLDSPEIVALGIIAVLRGATFVVDFLFGPARRRAHFGILMREPALWLVVVQGGVIVGILAATQMVEPAYAVWVIAGVKSILELVVRRTWRTLY